MDRTISKTRPIITQNSIKHQDNVFNQRKCQMAKSDNSEKMTENSLHRMWKSENQDRNVCNDNQKSVKCKVPHSRARIQGISFGKSKVWERKLWSIFKQNLKLGHDVEVTDDVSFLGGPRQVRRSSKLYSKKWYVACTVVSISFPQ